MSFLSSEQIFRNFELSDVMKNKNKQKSRDVAARNLELGSINKTKLIR